jgi:hypothetical protein
VRSWPRFSVRSDEQRGGERIIGGPFGPFETLASAQLYHPAIGRWQRIANMNHTRRGHTATLLANGQVLVTGGVGCGDVCPTGPRGHAELFDPNATTWTDMGSLPTARWYHQANSPIMCR